MPDTPQVGSPDSKRINIHEPYEVSYWCNKLNCTESELVSAVNAVGDSVAAVKSYLGK